MDELAAKVRWYINLRWFYLLGLSLPGLTALFASQGFSPVFKRSLIIALVGLFYNGLYFGLARIQTSSLSYFKFLGWAQVISDIVLTTFLVMSGGGVESRAIVLYAIGIIISGAMFGPWATFIAAIISIVFYNLVIILDYEGVVRFGDIAAPQLHGDAGYAAVTIAFYSTALLIVAAVSNFVTGLLAKQDAAVRKQSQALAEAQRIARVGSWEWDIKKNKVSWSDELYELYGLKPEEFGASYEAFMERVHPDDRAMVNTEIQKCLTNHKQFSFDHRLVRPDGKVLVLHAEGQVVVDDSGRPSKMRGTGQDVTEKFKANEALESRTKELENAKIAVINILEDLKVEKAKAESQSARDEAILASIGDGLLVLDNRGNVIIFNAAAANLSQVKSSDAIGKHYTKVINFYQDEDKSKPNVYIESALTGKLTSAKSNVRRFILQNGGSFLPVNETIAPIIDSKSKVNGVVVLFRDITKEYELQKAKDEFIGLASHQLRTPASAVKNFIGLLKEGYAGKLTKEQSKYVDQAYESNERQIQIVNDLLQVARTEAGQLIIHKEKNDITKLIEAAVVDQKSSIRAEKQSIVFERSDQKPIWAYYDEEHIRMVLDNLINNASKYTDPKGKITVSIEQARDTIKVSVRDNGVGIAKTDLNKLFKKFSRISNMKTRDVSGSGIGLYLVKKIIDLHKGQLEVNSTLGKGSVFSIILPKGDKH